MSFDARKQFKHMAWRPMPHSFGVDVPSDWQDKRDDDSQFGLYKRCGCWTDSEREILLACASQMSVNGVWCDIGAHTGLTSATINWGTNSPVCCVDPMLAVDEFRKRFEDNTGFPAWWICPDTSDELFRQLQQNRSQSSPQWKVNIDPGARPHHSLLPGESRTRWSTYKGFCVDGDHEPGMPLRDVVNAVGHLEPTGVILLHDFIGLPVRDAVTWLMNIAGFKVRVYRTPHMVAVAWRGDFVPPDHVSDPRLPDLFARCPEFDFSRCV